MVVVLEMGPCSVLLQFPPSEEFPNHHYFALHVRRSQLSGHSYLLPELALTRLLLGQHLAVSVALPHCCGCRSKFGVSFAMLTCLAVSSGRNPSVFVRGCSLYLPPPSCSFGSGPCPRLVAAAGTCCKSTRLLPAPKQRISLSRAPSVFEPL